MILVDSSVWIDFFRGRDTPQVKVLDALLGRQPLLMGDLILAEVLQGFDKQKDFDEARRLLSSLDLIQIGGADIAVKAAIHFRTLRGLGITVRKTIDTLIATRCIEDNLELLHSDQDFGAFAEHLGLRVVWVEPQNPGSN